jgi:hypothetical protein
MTFEILTILVLVNIGATIELWRLWRRAARRPEKLKSRTRLKGNERISARVHETAPPFNPHSPAATGGGTPGYNQMSSAIDRGLGAWVRSLERADV